MKKCVVVFENDTVEAALIRRALNSVMLRFTDHKLYLLFHSGSRDIESTNLKGIELLPSNTSLKETNPDAVVFAWPSAEKIPPSLRHVVAECPQYLVKSVEDSIPRLERLDGADYAHKDTHIWNRLSSTMDKGYVYNPFGYYYRMAGLGSLDPFGFRIAETVESLARRPSNHKVIAFFGGSATWSIYCLHNEMFTARLEVMLNSDLANKRTGLKFTCLNFGLISSTVLNEMMAYLLYASHFKPDLVVAHDGYNDMLYGSYTDPYLLKNWQITYQCDLEPWGHMIHKELDAEIIKTGQRPFQPRSVPDDIITAYVSRKLQFERVVRASGSDFVWAFQPLITHKSKPSAKEAEFLRALPSQTNDDWRDVRRGVHTLMSSTAKLVAGEREHLLDFDNIFRDAPAETTHFADTCHLTPEGDILVAEAYRDFLTAKEFFAALEQG